MAIPICDNCAKKLDNYDLINKDYKFAGHSICAGCNKITINAYAIPTVDYDYYTVPKDKNNIEAIKRYLEGRSMTKNELNELVKKSKSCFFYDNIGVIDDIDKALGIRAPCDFGAGQIGGSFYIDFYGNVDGDENFYKYIIPALKN